MKQLLFFLSALFYVTISQAQITAYRPEGATYSWWTQEWEFEEVGTGTVDSLEVNIDIKGQMATVNYRFYLRAIPNAENLNEDNDSLELKTTFLAPDNVIFTEMKMKMNDSMRVGRIIERSKADIIYENLVYDPNQTTTPKDPGYLAKDGSTYEFRAFPVGAEDLAYLELTSVIELETANSLTKEALVSLDLFAQAQENLEQISISYSISNDYDSALPTGVPLDWEQDSLGNYNADSSGFKLNSDLNLVLLNSRPHDVNYSFTDVPGYETHLWTLPTNGVGSDVACKYLIVLDIDYANLQSGDDYETFIVAKVEAALEGLSAIMKNGDSFRFSATHEYMLDYNTDWEPYSTQAFDNIAYWGLNNIGIKADIVAAATHAQSVTLGENAHTIIITNDYFDADIYNPADLEVLAENILQHNSDTHTDIYSLNQSPNTEMARIGKRKIDVHQTFFNEYTNRLNGVYDALAGKSDEQIKETVEKSALTLDRITTDVLPLARNYFRLSSAGNLSLYSKEAYEETPELLRFEYSSGQILTLDVEMPNKAEVDTNLRKLMGTAHMFTALTSSDKNAFVSKDYEEISLEYGLVTDYSALLVVEHDSQYNDTNELFTDNWWPQPLAANEIEPEELNASIQTFPNPATEAILIKADRDVLSIALYDVLGRVVIQRQLQSRSSFVELNQLASLSRGTYTLHVKLSDGSIEKSKVILQ